MDSKDEILRQIFSIPAIATYIGTALAIWAAIQNNLQMAVVCFAVISIILLLYLVIIYRKYQKYKLYKYIDSELHRLAHRTRDFVTTLRCAEDKTDVLHLTDAALRNALTVASNVFSILTKSKCSASLMARKNNHLKTILYCHNSDPQRESISGDLLPDDDGIAGEALAIGDAVFWEATDKRFKSTRDNFEKYYVSGISIPFKNGFEYAGLLNVDSLDKNIFNKKSHQEIGATISDSIGIILGAKDLWEDLYEG